MVNGQLFLFEGKHGRNKLLLKHLSIPTKGIYLHGDIFYMDVDDIYACLDIETAWSRLYDVYCKLAGHYGLDFV